MEKLNTTRLIEAAEKAIDLAVKSENANWQLIKQEVQDLVDERGNKLTVMVVVRPFDTRSREVEP